jgi:hypothetical protein
MRARTPEPCLAAIRANGGGDRAYSPRAAKVPSRAPCSRPGPGSSSLGEDAVNNAIVRLIVDFAHTLGHALTAEGVENDRQVASLMAMSCDMVQGFHFSRPLGSEGARGDEPFVADT